MNTLKSRLSNFIKEDWMGLLAILAGTGLRIYRLAAQPLWLDEIFTVQISRQSLLVLLQDSFKEPNPPLYHFLEMLVAGIWNVRSEFGYRWLSALAGTLTVIGFYLLCRRLTGRPMAALATLAFAISPFHVYYSQEARAFAVGTLLAVWSNILVVDILSAKPRTSRWVILAILSLLGIYTRYFYLLIVAVQGLILLVYTRQRNWWLYAALVALGSIPLFVMIYTTIPLTITQLAGRVALTPLTIIQSLAGEPARFIVGWQHWLLTTAICAIAILGLMIALLNKNNRPYGLSYGLQVAIPLLAVAVLGSLLGIQLPQYETRQFLIFLPPLFILFALGLEALYRHSGKLLPGLVMLSIIIASSAGLQAYWSLLKSPESSLVLSVRPEITPADRVVSLDYTTTAAAYFYLPDKPVLNYIRERENSYQFTYNLLLYPILAPESIPIADVTLQGIRQAGQMWVLTKTDKNPAVLAALTDQCTPVKTITIKEYSATLWENCSQASQIGQSQSGAIVSSKPSRN